MKPRHLRPTLIAAAAAWACSSACSQAETTQRVDISAPTALKLDERTRSGSRLGLTLREIPATVQVITRAELDALAVIDSQDALISIPGVSFSAQPGAAGSVFYRGFGASSLAQLYNGISVQYDAISARPIDSWLIARVESVGGPSSFLNGSGAVGGSINLITKIADLQGDLSQLRLGGGEQGQLALSLQRSLDTPAGGGHVLRLDVNGTQGAQRSQGRGRDTWQAAASWRAALGNEASHTLAVEQQYERVSQPYWGTPLQRNADNVVLGQVHWDPRTVDVNYNVVDGRYQQDVRWLRSIIETRLSPSTHLTHTLYHYDALRDYDNLETYSFVNQNSQVQRSGALLQRHDQRVWGSRGEITLAGQLAGRRSDFALGWDWSYNRQTRFPLSVTGPFDTTDPYAPADLQFLSLPGISRHYTPGATNQLHTGALFAENRTVPAPGWAVVSALRADHITLAVNNHRSATASNPALFTTSFSPVTGRLGLVRELSPRWQVYAQYSTAADPPAGVLATAGYSALRDFDLTTGRQIEVGSKASFDHGRGEASVALYRIVRQHLAITDPDDHNQVIPVGQQSSRGVEINARWRVAPAWQLAGHASYTDAQFDSFVESVGSTTVSRAGNRPANTPDWVAGLTATWQPLLAVSLATDWRHVGRRYGNTANTVWDGAYDLLGLTASWQVHPRGVLRARVANLTDKVYAATVGSNQVYLGPPRTVQLSADWRF
jgi:iron complex outermembrane recepter protein